MGLLEDPAPETAKKSKPAYGKGSKQKKDTITKRQAKELGDALDKLDEEKKSKQVRTKKTPQVVCDDYEDFCKRHGIKPMAWSQCTHKANRQKLLEKGYQEGDDWMSCTECGVPIPVYDKAGLDQHVRTKQHTNKMKAKEQGGGAGTGRADEGRSMIDVDAADDDPRQPKIAPTIRKTAAQREELIAGLAAYEGLTDQQAAAVCAVIRCGWDANMRIIRRVSRMYERLWKADEVKVKKLAERYVGRVG